MWPDICILMVGLTGIYLGCALSVVPLHYGTTLAAIPAQLHRSGVVQQVELVGVWLWPSSLHQ